MTFEDVVINCREILKTFPAASKAREYVDNRISKEAQEKFSFGFFPPTNQLKILFSFIKENDLFDLNLLYDKIIKDDYVRNIVRFSSFENHNLILPYKDVYGNTIALVGRTLLTEEERTDLNIPKYKNTSFKKGHHLFGLFEAKSEIIKSDKVFIVEGQFDCISAHDKGMKNVVALGSSNMTFDQVALLSRYTNNFILLLDNDVAGNAGAGKILHNYSNIVNIKKGKIPDGYKDICELLESKEVDDLKFIDI